MDLDADGSYDVPQLDAKGFIKSLPWTLTATTGSVPSTSPALRLDVNGNGTFDAGDQYNGTQVQVFRQPVKTAAHPLQLPNAMAIDLEWSGGSNLSTLNGYGPITILFSPTGALRSLQYYVAGKPYTIPLTSPLYLLIGRQENIGSATPNYQDQRNFWVTLQPMTGLITSTEIGPDADSNGTITLAESRYFAERSMVIGGR